MQLSIVSFLDRDATEKVRQLQKTLSEITGSKASLTSWLPHITLGDGVDIAESELSNLIAEIKQVVDSVPAFSVFISGFSSLDSRPIGVGEISTPYAIFIDVILNPKLIDIVSRIARVTATHKIWYHMPSPYLPHVTLAFRDLGEAGYRSGLSYLEGKDIELKSSIDHIALVQKLPDSDTEVARVQLS